MQLFSKKIVSLLFQKHQKGHLRDLQVCRMKFVATRILSLEVG